MKEITVKFNNVWNDSGNGNDYEIIIFCIPDEMNIDIRKEVDVLDNCHWIFNDFDCENEDDLEDALEEYNEVTLADLNIAKDVLENGDTGLIPSRIADFISKKHPGVTWTEMRYRYDLEIDVN